MWRAPAVGTMPERRTCIAKNLIQISRLDGNGRIKPTAQIGLKCGSNPNASNFRQFSRKSDSAAKAEFGALVSTSLLSTKQPARKEADLRDRGS